MQNQGSIGGSPATVKAKDQFSFQLPIGTYANNAAVLAAAVTAGYAGAGNTIYSLQLIASPGGFTWGTAVPRATGSGSQLSHEGEANADGTYLGEMDSYSITVVDDVVEANLVVFTA